MKSLMIRWLVKAYKVYLSIPVHRGSYMSAHVLLNILNKLGKGDKMRGLAKHFITFFASLINLIIQEHEMLDSIDHTTLKLLSNHNFWHEKFRFCYLLRNLIMDVINYITLLVYVYSAGSQTQASLCKI